MFGMLIFITSYLFTGVKTIIAIEQNRRYLRGMTNSDLIYICWFIACTVLTLIHFFDTPGVPTSVISY